MAKRKVSNEPPPPFDTPAKVTDKHFVVNPEDPERWWRFGVRDDHPLARAYMRGQLAAGRREYTAEDRYGAGMIYRGIWAGAHGSEMAVSNLHRVSGGANKERASDSLCVARSLLKRVNEGLHPDNAFIIQAICGEGRFFSEAVRERHIGFEKAVYPRVCVALDDLLDVVLRMGLKKP